MKIYSLFFLIILLQLAACTSDNRSVKTTLPEEGIWRGVLKMQGDELPFNFTIKRKADSGYELNLMNDSEQILIDDADIEGDTLNIPMHIFDTNIKLKVGQHKMTGFWIKNYAKDYRIPLTAYHNEEFRFESDKKAAVNMTGKYQVYFLNENDSSLAIGEFFQDKEKLTGTFLTPTGDYRYLEGIVSGNEFSLSTFDGEHAFIFTGKVNSDNTLSGIFRSGKSWNRPWVGILNANASLPDPDKMTFLKEGYKSIDFKLPDMEGNLVSPNDLKYKNKVLIIQVFGTWCPNCMDETKFLSDWYRRNKQRGVEIIALSFERKNDFDYAKSRIDRMTNRYQTEYDFLFAGPSDKDEALKVLPMLNQIISFPTTIFIDKKGKVRRIHTGFSGPGTRDVYTEFIADFNLFMDKLLTE